MHLPQLKVSRALSVDFPSEEGKIGENRGNRGEAKKVEKTTPDSYRRLTQLRSMELSWHHCAWYLARRG